MCPRDETTGETLPPRKKFKADKLQRGYDYYVDLYGFSKKQVRAACYYLRDQGLIDLDFRTVEYKSRHGTRRANNVLYIGLNWQEVQRISQDAQKSEDTFAEKVE